MCHYIWFWLVSVDCNRTEYVNRFFFLVSYSCQPWCVLFSISVPCDFFFFFQRTLLSFPRGISLPCGISLIFSRTFSSCFITPLDLSLKSASLSLGLSWQLKVNEVWGGRTVALSPSLSAPVIFFYLKRKSEEIKGCLVLAIICMI